MTDARKRNRTAAPKRKAMPKILRRLGDEAIERMHARTATPEIAVTDRDGVWSYGSPYNEGDGEDRWSALLFDAFATRSAACFETFTDQLAKLCPRDWQPHDRAWKPEADFFRAAIQIVRSMEVRNEAEAAYAAQLVALHVASMKLGHQVASTSYPDSRTVAILGKTVRAYGDGLETLARLKGQKISRQTIVVEHHQHIHQHHHDEKHVHLGGGSENGDRPHEARGSDCAEECGAGKPAERTPLPSAQQGAEAVRFPGDAWQARVQAPRRPIHRR